MVWDESSSKTTLSVYGAMMLKLRTRQMRCFISVTLADLSPVACRLPLRYFARDQVDRVDTENADLVLMPGVEMRDVIGAPA